MNFNNIQESEEIEEYKNSIILVSSNINEDKEPNDKINLLLKKSTSDFDESIKQQQQLQIQPEKKKNWLNIWIVFIVLFLSESARGMVLPTISLYVLSVGGNSTFLGVVVSSFSLGRFISTILLGYLSSRFNYRKIFIFAVTICIFGSIIYCFAYLDQGAAGKTMLIISRLLLGFGAGTLSVVRAYITEVSSVNERTTYMSWTSSIQFFGFAITPIFASTISYFPMFYIEGPVKVNLLTYPGYFLWILNSALLLLLIFIFKNPKNNKQPLMVDQEKNQKLTASGKIMIVVPVVPIEEKQQSILSLIRNDKKVLKPLVVFIVLNLLVRALLGIYETLGTPIYTLLNDDIDNTSGFYFGGMGVIGIIILLGLGHVSKKQLIDDFWVLIIGCSILVLGCLICISHEMNWGRFISSSILIWCIGYPLAQTVIVSMFSKSIPPSAKGQLGTFMGIIGAAGSLGRIIGPLSSGLMFTNTVDTFYVFLFASSLSIITFLISFLIMPIHLKEKVNLFFSKKFLNNNYKN